MRKGVSLLARLWRDLSIPNLGRHQFLLFAASKADLAKLFEARQVIQFAEFYPVGHRSTNYKKFFESDVPYPIKFKSGYEPYVLVSRKHMPWYDERFRGYGWDKVLHASE